MFVFFVCQDVKNPVSKLTDLASLPADVNSFVLLVYSPQLGEVITESEARHVFEAARGVPLWPPSRFPFLSRAA